CKQQPVDGLSSMPIAQAAFVVMKACEGLDYAHNKKDANGRDIQLVHRDVSPQNILISYEGEVKLIDFGIAKAAGKASKTQQGILKGKFGYMSPEQVRGLPLDRRSDIFSLGIVLYELLTGERLFIGESDFSTLEKVRNVEILPPSTYNRRITDELERIVLKALAKDVDDRYQNAIDLHDDLQAFMYTAGEFYSRKDLAAWMKRVFVKEMEEESAKLEQYRHMPVPPVAPSVQQPMPGIATQPERPRKPSGQVPQIPATPPPRPSGAHAIVPPPAPGKRNSGPMAAVAAAAAPGGNARPANGSSGHGSDLSWDDEELATNIYSAEEEAALAPSVDDDEDDAADAIVDDKPDLSKVELNPNGAPVPHHSVVQKLPTAPSQAPPMQAAQAAMLPSELKVEERRNGAPAGRRNNPFDYVLPDSQHGAVASETPPVQMMRARRKPIGAIVGAVVGVAAVCLVIAAAITYFNSRPGTLYIESQPSTSVQVLLDNKKQAVEGTPATLALEPGSYVLTVQREGYVPWNEQVEIKAGDTTRRKINLEPLASGTGFTLVSEPAGAQALLDGRALEGVTPLKVQSVMPGKHKIEVRSSLGTWAQEVNIEAGKMLDVRCQLATPKAAEPAKLPPPAPSKAVAKAAEPPPVKLPPPPRVKEEPVKTAAVKSSPVRTVAATPKKSREPSTTLPDEDAPAKAPAEKPAPPEKTASAPAGDGWLRLGSKPSTSIAVDGKDTGLHTPQTKLKLATGSHRITLTNAQFNIKETFSVDIKAGETETVIKDLRQQGSDND
ncbi:MAG TPA: PEGA domain-containing protein, partial [Polyangia bacterium]|nr:PEGA domain-containing protein [Polyangia bacterium]